jgi:dTDP-4-dehydrorhamnose reductase
MLGTDVVLRFNASGHDVEACDRTRLDLTDAEHVRECIATTRPDVVVNCAAFTAVDRCETEPDAAYAGNLTAPSNVALACTTTDTRMIHISTDYVFDGNKATPYLETDATNPLSVYGESKLAGERAVLDILGDQVLVLRTSWVCGEFGANMVKTVLRLIDGDGPMRFVGDQRGCPTFTEDLARAIEAFADSPAHGIFHVTNQGAVSWFEFVRDIVRLADGDVHRVSPITTEELQPPRPAHRPANSVLENRAMADQGFALLDHYELPLQRLIARLR